VAELRVLGTAVEAGGPADEDGDAVGTPLPQKIKNARVAIREYRQWARETTDPHERAFYESQAREEERRLARLAQTTGPAVARPRPARPRGQVRQLGRRVRRTRTVAKTAASSGDDGPAPPSPGPAIVGRPLANFLALNGGLSGPDLAAKFDAQPRTVKTASWAALREAIERRRAA
jgi:hypothetical protein